MQISAKNLAQLLHGTVEGDETVCVTRPGKIESGEKGMICFLGNAQYEPFAYTTRASILLVSRDFQPTKPLIPTLIRVDNVYESLAFLLEKFGKNEENNTQNTISAHAIIHPSVKMGQNVSIGDFAILEEGVLLGDNCKVGAQVFIGKNTQIQGHVVLHSGVKLYPNTQIGNRCILHAGAVIGCDGFGFAPQTDGSYKKIHHLGNVVLEDDVEVGANTTIDRGSIGATLIRRGVKLDNLIQIAHNVEIGENTVIAAQTGIAGSTKIGKNCRIGGQVGIGGHLTIGDNVQMQGQSGVTTNWGNGVKLYGYPAIPITDYLRSYAVFKKLPEMYREWNLWKKQSK
jgi:UDP-3-O-[3-hydroxymyristoyl] glucosamine N-acyltransferase